METLTAGRWPVVELLLDEDLPREVLDEAGRLASAVRLRLQEFPGSRLTELCRTEEHQGFLARMGEFPCGTFEDLQQQLRRTQEERSAEGRGLPPLYVVCDRLQDAHNFGAILRCCDASQVDGVIIGERAQVSVTPHVARASSGAVNHLSLYRVPVLLEALRELKTHGVIVMAASEKSDSLLWNCDMRGAQAMIVGSEATGIAPELLAEASTPVAIPMLGGVASLNAAVAAGIVLYECRRQHMSERL
jgi:23S rRNA (guanosine2251-2'-O)-methyltransferase